MTRLYGHFRRRAPFLDRLRLARWTRRLYHAVRLAARQSDYRRALADLCLDRLPLGPSLKRLYYALRFAARNSEYRRALVGLCLDRLPLGPSLKQLHWRCREKMERARSARRDRAIVRAYRFSDDELRAFAAIVSKLDLPVPADQSLAALISEMTEADLGNLLGLLRYVTQQPCYSNEHTAPVTICRATDLEPVRRGTRRRNILFVSAQFPNPLHAGGARVADFIKVMSVDHDVYLYAWYDPLEDVEAFKAIRPFCRGIRGVSYQDFAFSTATIREFVSGIPIDVVHYEWPRSLTNLDPSLGRSHIFTYMEAVSLRLLRDMSFERPLSKRWVRKLVELLSSLKIEVVDAAKADLRIALTQDDAEFFARFNPQARYVILNTGMNLDEFCEVERAPEEATLVYVGNYQHYPNEDAVHFFFGKVFPQIKSEVPEAKVYIVGASPSRSVRAYHDGKRVIVTGKVPDVRPYIQRAEVCIAPLVSGAGFRGKVAQYALLRRVCVATSIAAADLAFEDGRDIFIADDPALFAQRVVYLLQHPEVRQRMATRAYRKAIKHYDNRHLVRCLYRVYEDCESTSDSPSAQAYLQETQQSAQGPMGARSHERPLTGPRAAGGDGRGRQAAGAEAPARPGPERH